MIPIFISHSSEDNAAAAELKTRLSERGYHGVFLDVDAASGIAAGKQWEGEIYRHMRRSNAVIVLCSEASMKSAWVFAEIVQARSAGKTVFPVKIKPCTILSLLQDRQIVDLTSDPAAGYNRLFSGLIEAGLDPDSTFSWAKNRRPYPGLEAFQEEDAAVFFGRDDETRDALAVLNRLRRFDERRALVVVGGSGSGKSSLLRAGIIPHLKRDAHRWLVIDPFRPADDPLREMARAVAAAFRHLGATVDWATLHQQWLEAVSQANAQERLRLLIGKIQGDLLIAAGRPEAALVLVIDQFEETFGRPTLTPSFGAVLRAWLMAGSSATILAALRSDFLAGLEKHPELSALAREQFYVRPLKKVDFAKAIEGPAQLAEIELGSGLVQALVDDAETDDALPLLAYALREMWEKYGDDNRLTIEEYRDLLGGLGGAIGKTAEEAIRIAGVPYDELELKRAFVKLVRVNADGVYTRQTARWDDLPAGVHGILAGFVSARLLVSRGDGAGRTLEVAHEALFRTWSKLAGWLQENQSFLMWRQRLDSAIAEWQRTGLDAGAYMRGVGLAEARRWAADWQGDLSATEIAFIEQSAANEERERLRREKQTRRLVWTLAGGLLISAAFGVTAWIQYQRQKAEAGVALSRQLAAEAVGQIPSKPDLALLLAVEAVAFSPTVEAKSSLLQALDSTEHVLRVLHDEGAPGVPIGFLDDHSLLTAAIVRAPGFNLIPRTLVSWELSNATARRDLVTFTQWKRVRFSADGQTYAVLTDNTVRVGRTAEL
jgi:hypothetical protein